MSGAVVCRWTGRPAVAACWHISACGCQVIPDADATSEARASSRALGLAVGRVRGGREEAAVSGRAHEHTCWRGDHYEHTCQQPSGRRCIDCGAPAGTLWGQYWCPDCDVKRLDGIRASLDEIAASLGGLR